MRNKTIVNSEKRFTFVKYQNSKYEDKNRGDNEN